MLARLKLKTQGPPPNAPPDVDHVSARVVFQNRTNRGPNLGLLFVLEKYMYPDMFPADQHAELEEVTAYRKQHGAGDTAKWLEDHYTLYMDDGDWQWIREHANAVRLPVGYWHLDGGRFARGTPFGKVADCYPNAWSHVVRVIETAARFDVAVLVDLHAVPEGANTGDHSGMKLSRAGFWNDAEAMVQTADALEWLALQVKQYDNVCGIQVVNEAEFSNDGKYQMRYYTAALHAIRKQWAEVPVVVSDGWWPQQWAEWVSGLETNTTSIGVMIDDHVYRCFSDEDKGRLVPEAIDCLEGNLLSGVEPAADFVVGEYLCVLDGQLWDKTSGDREELVRRFGERQLQLLRERSAGSYFWLYKFQHGDGGEWGYRPMVERGGIAPPVQVQVKGEDQLAPAREARARDHSNYWSSQDPNGHYEHQRFEDGFTCGWLDAHAFAQVHGLQLGRRVAWKKARRGQHIRDRGDSLYVWEWDQGYDQGLAAYEQ